MMSGKTPGRDSILTGERKGQERERERERERDKKKKKKKKKKKRRRMSTDGHKSILTNITKLRGYFFFLNCVSIDCYSLIVSSLNLTVRVCKYI